MALATLRMAPLSREKSTTTRTQQGKIGFGTLQGRIGAAVFGRVVEGQGGAVHHFEGPALELGGGGDQLVGRVRAGLEGADKFA